MLEKCSEQLQLRVTPSEKKKIQQMAKKSGMTMSTWVRSRLLSSHAPEFRDLLLAISQPETRRVALAELNTWLVSLNRMEFSETVAQAPLETLNLYLGNYVAAMVEVAAHQKRVSPPAWTKNYTGLDRPDFGSDLKALRLHLLASSPPPFRRRNIFIDSSIGDRV